MNRALQNEKKSPYFIKTAPPTTIRERFLWGLGAFTAVVATTLLWIYPNRPSDWIGWCLLVLVILPLIILGTGAIELLFGSALKNAASAGSSVGRVFRMLGIALVGIVLFIGIWAMMSQMQGSSFGSVMDFFDQHFSEW